jgi:uncharacterized protein YciI
MQFLVIAFDGKDEGARERRLAAREAHIKLGDQLLSGGHFWYGCAILNDNAEMVGSMMVVDFPSSEQLQEWLGVEPYVVEGVWRDIKVHPCSVRNPSMFNR